MRPPIPTFEKLHRQRCVESHVRQIRIHKRSEGSPLLVLPDHGAKCRYKVPIPLGWRVSSYSPVSAGHSFQEPIQQ